METAEERISPKPAFCNLAAGERGTAIRGHECGIGTWGCGGEDYGVDDDDAGEEARVEVGEVRTGDVILEQSSQQWDRTRSWR